MRHWVRGVAAAVASRAGKGCALRAACIWAWTLAGALGSEVAAGGALEATNRITATAAEAAPAHATGATEATVVPEGEPAPAHGLWAPTEPITAPNDPLGSPNLIDPKRITPADAARVSEETLENARRQRRDGNFVLANFYLTQLLKTNASPEIKQRALLEIAQVAQELNQPTRAQDLFGQYLRLYPNDVTVPEVYLRQGLLYRHMGMHSIAITKFYAVMTSALGLRFSNLEYYQRLVLQAQAEIADTYYLNGKHDQAAEMFRRLLMQDSPSLNKTAVHYKLVRALSFLERPAETAAQASLYLEQNPTAAEVPEVRFLLAVALKAMGRGSEALAHVLQLLETQRAVAAQKPEVWAYWQQRTGNEVANQFYKEGEYTAALEIYLTLAGLNSSPTWQLPAWYQIGLVCERLQQPMKAQEMYARIVGRRAEVEKEGAPPGLVALLEMAEWRQKHLAWRHSAELKTAGIGGNALTNMTALEAAQVPVRTGKEGTAGP